MKNAMPNNQTKLLRIYRLLTPENRAELLSRVHLAHFAENSARKALSPGQAADGVSIMQSREYSCGNKQ
jgi:predicted phosphoadenosine phosphosulfate sulfurtransferase